MVQVQEDRTSFHSIDVGRPGHPGTVDGLRERRVTLLVDDEGAQATYEFVGMAKNARVIDARPVILTREELALVADALAEYAGVDGDGPVAREARGLAERLSEIGRAMDARTARRRGEAT